MLEQRVTPEQLGIQEQLVTPAPMALLVQAEPLEMRAWLVIQVIQDLQAIAVTLALTALVVLVVLRVLPATLVIQDRLVMLVRAVVVAAVVAVVHCRTQALPVL